jgi:predicted phage-related endonuclease
MTPEEERRFHEERLTGIGASEVAAAMGIDPWMSAQELYYIKTGQMKAPDLSGSKAIVSGSRLESAVADWCLAEIQKDYPTARMVHYLPAVRSKEWPWLLSHYDRVVQIDLPFDYLVNMECKAVRSKYKKEDDESVVIWGDTDGPNVPMNYFVQAQAQMMCEPRFAYTELAAFIKGSDDWLRYRIEPNRDIFDLIAAGTKSFWDRVTDYRENGIDNPPDPDYDSEPYQSFVKRRFDKIEKDSVLLDDIATSLRALIVDANSRIKDLQSVVESSKAQLLTMIGDKEYGIFPDGTGYKRSYRAPVSYVCEKSGYIELRFSKNPGK